MSSSNHRNGGDQWSGHGQRSRHGERNGRGQRNGSGDPGREPNDPTRDEHDSNSSMSSRRRRQREDEEENVRRNRMRQEGNTSDSRNLHLRAVLDDRDLIEQEQNPPRPLPRRPEILCIGQKSMMSPDDLYSSIRLFFPPCVFLFVHRQF